MDVIEWLKRIGKLNQMIDAKLDEMERLRTIATNTVGQLDGMPHAPGISDKVGKMAVKLAVLEQEIDDLIDKYIDHKRDVANALEKLSAEEYGILHKYYIVGMTLEQIAEGMGYCKRQISRIKKKGLKNLEDVLECHPTK